jgi:hypothetical protein
LLSVLHRHAVRPGHHDAVSDYLRKTVVDMEQLRDAWIDAISRKDWERCAALSFEVIYRLPDPQYLDPPRVTLRRYLPVFAARWPEERWVRDVIEDPQRWVRDRDRRLPDEPQDANAADAEFLASLDALLLAQTQSTDRDARTSASATALVSAISARAVNVWLADDPDAERAWADGSLTPARGPRVNVAAAAVLTREWTASFEQLASYAAVEHEIDADQLRQTLNRWRDNEMLPEFRQRPH